MKFEVRKGLFGTWAIWDNSVQGRLNETYELESVAKVACDAMNEGIMVPTRGSYTREAWSRAQKSWVPAHQDAFATPAEVAENVAQVIHERSVSDRLLLEAVPWLA